MDSDYDRPDFEDKEDILCRVCVGHDCPKCGGTGVETISRAEAKWENEQERYDDYYDRDTRG